LHFLDADSLPGEDGAEIDLFPTATSLPDVLPGKEIVKELKEHAEAGYEVGEHLAEQREAK
jgi:hypothetical protein